jgi:hypothetical protein
MYRIIIDRITANPGKKPQVVECYRQEFPDLDVLELVAKMNAPSKAPRKTPAKKAEASKSAAKPTTGAGGQS